MTIDDDYLISMIINDINRSYWFLMTNNGSQYCFFIILMDLTAITGSFKRNLLTYLNDSLPY